MIRQFQFLHHFCMGRFAFFLGPIYALLQVRYLFSRQLGQWFWWIPQHIVRNVYQLFIVNFRWSPTSFAVYHWASFTEFLNKSTNCIAMRYRCCWEFLDTHSEYIIFTALPWQKWLRERILLLHYTYITCIALFGIVLRWKFVWNAERCLETRCSKLDWTLRFNEASHMVYQWNVFGRILLRGF
jgi:hypothetical protein